MSEKLRFDSYRQWAEAITPGLRAALVGDREVSPQPPFIEAWLADALFYYDTPLSLEDVIESADAINHSIPNPDEVAWAFLRLRNRGWLAEQGNLYGLTAGGRRTIEAIVGRDFVLDGLERLTKWVSTHSP